MLSFRYLTSLLTQPLYQFRDTLDFFLICQGSKLKINLLLQARVVILRKASLKLLQISIFQMPYPVKAGL